MKLRSLVREEERILNSRILEELVIIVNKRELMRGL